MPNKSLPKVLLDILADRLEFSGGALVNRSEWRGLAGFQRDLVVIRLMGQQFVSFFLTEQVGEFMILKRNCGKVELSDCCGDFLVRNLSLLELRH